jgi:MFS family permease
VCTWTAYGTGHIQSDWSWRIPVILQAIPSLVVMAVVWLMPESPRWLFANNKTETGTAILVKYHGNGNPDSAMVQLEIREITEVYNIELEASDKRWWDYRGLFNNRASLYRVWLLTLVSVLSQFIGGSVIRYS